MARKELVKFIKDARKKGFDDYQIKSPLVAEGWPINEISDAFASLNPKVKYKNKLCIFLDSEVLQQLEKRAKKNLFTIAEQVEDILRRSVITSKRGSSTPNEKLDDALIGVFSRRKRKSIIVKNIKRR